MKNGRTKFVLIVVTDGEENASRSYTFDTVREMLVKVQRELGERGAEKIHKRGWKVFFLGAGQDAVLSGTRMGFTSGRSMTYTADSMGTSHAYGAVSRAMTGLAKGDDAEFSEADRTRAVGGSEPEHDPSAPRPGECPECKVFRIDGEPPVIHHQGCSRSDEGFAEGMKRMLRVPRPE